MADLSGGIGQARAQNGRTAAGINLPVPTTRSPGVRSPRDIMRDREKREALRKLEQEHQNRVRTGRASGPTAGVGGIGESGDTGTENRKSTSRTNQDTLAQLEGIQKEGRTGDVGYGRTGPSRGQDAAGARSTSQPVPQQSTRTARNSGRPTNPSNQQQPQATRAASGPAGTTRTSADPPRPPQAASNQSKKSSTTFPHAFERWETLSSHWEGLTSFWISKLEGNSEELSRQPINQQLARQVTDLSAAGANLFHAVVELQRLRASSERKFQRWFFETRAEQQESTERIAQLESELAVARQGVPIQAAAVPLPSPEEIQKQSQRLAADEIEKVKRHCALEIKEKNRELEISREEARRGWEEIGRMEQENRERTISLRRGEPTVLGGVQVVPLQGNVSTTGGGQSGGLSSHPTAVEDPGFTGYDVTRSETDTDPFTESGRDAQAVSQASTGQVRLPPSSSAAIQAAQKRTASASPARPQTAGQPFASSSVYATEPTTSSTSGGFYQQSGAGTTLHPQARQDQRPYMASDPDEEEYQVDEHGRPLVSPLEPPIRPHTGVSEVSDEYEVLEQLERDQFVPRGYPGDYGQTQGHPITSNGGSYQAATDYSTDPGYGGNWQSAVPRHHHPSRLSDVLEEDERSRTSETSRRYPH